MILSIPLPEREFYFKKDILVLFLHNRNGTLEFPDSEQPCQALENPTHPSSFTWINPILLLYTLGAIFHILFQIGHFGAFLHNSYGPLEFPGCGNLEGTDWMGDMRWANTEPSMHFRETNTDTSVHFRKVNTDLFMHFRKANTKFLVRALLPPLVTISLPSLYPFLLPVLNAT